MRFNSCFLKMYIIICKNGINLGLATHHRYEFRRSMFSYKISGIKPNIVFLEKLQKNMKNVIGWEFPSYACYFKDTLRIKLYIRSSRI